MVSASVSGWKSVKSTKSARVRRSSQVPSRSAATVASASSRGPSRYTVCPALRYHRPSATEYCGPNPDSSSYSVPAKSPVLTSASCLRLS